MKQQREIRRPIKTFLRDENGAIGVILTVMLPVVVGFMTLSVDATYLYTAQNQLQIAADAAALAAVQELSSYTGTVSKPCATATSYSLCTQATILAGYSPTYYNEPTAAGKTKILVPSTDIVVGQWNTDSTPAKFVPCNPCSPSVFPNAVQVTTRMTSANGNALQMYFTPMLSAIAKGAGFTSFSLTATATAAYSGVGAGSGAGTGKLSNPMNLIIVQDISGSFTPSLGQAQTAAQDCAQYFQLTGGSSSYFGMTLLTGNSPQKNWQPDGWTNPTSWSKTNPAPAGWKATNNYTSPYYPLTSATAPTCTTATQTGCWVTAPTITPANTTINGVAKSTTTATGCGGNASTPYFCSGSDIGSGMQSAINQFCPTSTACGETVQNPGTTEMIVITDGDPNCAPYGGGDPYGGTSDISGQNCGTGGNSQLLSNAQALATLAGQDGISVSTIYYSGDGTCGTCQTDLKQLTTNSATQLNKYHPGATQPQFFNQPSAAALAGDMLQICSAGRKPRLVT